MTFKKANCFIQRTLSDFQRTATRQGTHRYLWELGSRGFWPKDIWPSMNLNAMDFTLRT